MTTRTLAIAGSIAALAFTAAPIASAVAKAPTPTRHDEKTSFDRSRDLTHVDSRDRADWSRDVFDR
jgi:hypothetical protein